MEKKISFIGCDNTGKTILDGLIVSGQVLPGQIQVYTSPPDKVTVLHDQFGISAAEPVQEVAQITDIIFTTVKPGIMIKAPSEITSGLSKDSLVVLITAGITLDQLTHTLGYDRRIIRAMSNIPALVNVGMTSVTPNALVTPEDTADVLDILRCFGEAEVIAGPITHSVAGVSGSSPTCVFTLIGTMADVAIPSGMPRTQAYKFAAQAVMGSAKMVLETGEHPGTPEDMVCLPGGTTVEVVRVLEEKGSYAAVIEAVTKCMEKSEKLNES